MLIYFHGGGWVSGDLESTDSAVQAITVDSGFICISVDYRRTPAHPCPAIDVPRTLANTVFGGEIGLDINLRRTAISRDSAGGNLAAAVAQEIRDGIAHQVLTYLVMDLSHLDIQSHIEFFDGYYLTAHRIKYFYGADQDRTDPGLSPGLTPDLNSLPSENVATVELDPLVDEVEGCAHVMLESGEKVNIVCLKGQVYPSFNMDSIITDALVMRLLAGTELCTAMIP